MEEYFRGFSISTGTIRHNNLGYILTTKDDLIEQRVPHTRIFAFYQGNWGGQDIEWMACSASVCYVPEEKFIAIGEAGYVQTVGGGQNKEESPIVDGSYSPQARGPLREVRGIAHGRAYAVGTCRQAYRRDEEGKWVCIDQSAQTPVDDITDTSFESIDGFSEKDIYAVGWEGEIWRYNGKLWRQIDSPTNLALYKVRCSENGVVYACGQVGTLLRGKGDQWESLKQEEVSEDLWGMEYFHGKLYVSSTHFVYELVDDQLRLVGFGDTPPPTSCYHLSAADGILWSIGAKELMEFDGVSWKEILKL